MMKAISEEGRIRKIQELHKVNRINQANRINQVNRISLVSKSNKKQSILLKRIEPIPNNYPSISS